MLGNKFPDGLCLVFLLLFQIGDFGFLGGDVFLQSRKFLAGLFVGLFDDGGQHLGVIKTHIDEAQLGVVRILQNDKDVAFHRAMFRLASHDRQAEKKGGKQTDTSGHIF